MAKSPTIVFYEIPSLICRLIFEFENSKISIRKEAEVKLQPSATSLIHVWQSWREKLKIAHCTRTGNSLLPPSVVRLLLVRPVIQEQSWTLLGQLCKTWVTYDNKGKFTTSRIGKCPVLKTSDLVYKDVYLFPSPEWTEVSRRQKGKTCVLWIVRWRLANSLVIFVRKTFS